jgi:hypothetical protein
MQEGQGFCPGTAFNELTNKSRTASGVAQWGSCDWGAEAGADRTDCEQKVFLFEKKKHGTFTGL